MSATTHHRTSRLALALTLAAGMAVAGCAGRLHPYSPANLDRLKQERGRVAQLMKEHADDKAVTLYREAVKEHHVDFGSGHWTSHQVFVWRYLVIDPKHQPLTEFDSVMPKGIKIVRAELTVLPSKGEPRHFTEKDLVQEKRRRKRTGYKLAFPAVTRGTLIEVRLATLCDDPRKHDGLEPTFRLSSRYPTLRSVARFIFPSKWDVAIKLTPKGRRPKVSIEQRGDRTVVTADRRNLPAQPDSVYSPHDEEDGEYLKFFVRGAETPNMIRYVKKTWPEVAKTYLEYVVNQDAVFSSSVAREARKVVKGIDDPLKRFKAIVQHVQRSIRLDEEWEDKDFPKVLKTKRGSQYQITGLTNMMLKDVGIDARFVMIHSATDGHYDKIFVCFNELDTAAVMARIDGKEHLALPYARGLAIGVLPADLQGRQAFKIYDNGFDGFFKTPVISADKDHRVDRFTVQLTKDGELRIKEVRTYSGLDAYEARDELEDLKPARLKKKLKKWRTYDDGEARVTRTEVRHREQPEKPLIIEYDYTIDNLVTVAGDEAIMQAGGLLSSSTRKKRLDEHDRRIRPLRSYREHIYQREVELRLPRGWSLARVPRDNAFKNRLGQVKIRFDASKPGVLQVKQTRTMNRFNLPPTAFKDLVALMGKRSKLNVPTLVFRTGAAPASAPASAPAASQPAGGSASR